MQETNDIVTLIFISPKDQPWSLSKVTIVLSSCPDWDKASKTFPISEST